MTKLTKHKCPYGGWWLTTDTSYVSESGSMQTIRWDCGVDGWLCKRCEQDMAGKRCADTLLQINSLWTGLEQVMLTMVDLIKRQNPTITFKPPKPEMNDSPKLGGVIL